MDTGPGWLERELAIDSEISHEPLAEYKRQLDEKQGQRMRSLGYDPDDPTMAHLIEGLGPAFIPTLPEYDASSAQCVDARRRRYDMLMNVTEPTWSIADYHDNLRNYHAKFPEFLRRWRSHYALDAEPGWLERELASDLVYVL